jgi:hypothetical protein
MARRIWNGLDRIVRKRKSAGVNTWQNRRGGSGVPLLAGRAWIAHLLDVGLPGQNAGLTSPAQFVRSN